MYTPLRSPKELHRKKFLSKRTKKVSNLKKIDTLTF